MAFTAIKKLQSVRSEKSIIRHIEEKVFEKPIRDYNNPDDVFADVELPLVKVDKLYFKRLTLDPADLYRALRFAQDFYKFYVVTVDLDLGWRIGDTEDKFRIIKNMLFDNETRQYNCTPKGSPSYFIFRVLFYTAQFLQDVIMTKRYLQFVTVRRPLKMNHHHINIRHKNGAIPFTMADALYAGGITYFLTYMLEQYEDITKLFYNVLRELYRVSKKPIMVNNTLEELPLSNMLQHLPNPHGFHRVFFMWHRTFDEILAESLQIREWQHDGVITPNQCALQLKSLAYKIDFRESVWDYDVRRTMLAYIQDEPIWGGFLGCVLDVAFGYSRDEMEDY